MCRQNWEFVSSPKPLEILSTIDGIMKWKQWISLIWGQMSMWFYFHAYAPKAWGHSVYIKLISSYSNRAFRGKFFFSLSFAIGNYIMINEWWKKLPKLFGYHIFVFWLALIKGSLFHGFYVAFLLTYNIILSEESLLQFNIITF